MSVIASLRKLVSVQESIPLKPQDWRDADYALWLVGREGIHALLSFTVTLGIIGWLGDSLEARIAVPSLIVAIIGVMEFIHTLRGQQPWKGALDLLVWIGFAVLATAVY